MELDDYFFLGKIGKPRSFKGEVFFYFDNDEPELYADLDAYFILIGKRLVSYPIEKITFKNGSTAIIKFEGIETAEEADSIKNKEVYLPLELLPEDDETVYLHDLVDCRVIDEVEGEIGIVREVNDQTAQRLLILNDPNNEIIIPYVENFIVEIDLDQKIIKTSLPAGLININE